MDPQAFPILVSLSKMIDELGKIIAEGNAKHQAGASVLPAKSQTIDEKPDNMSELKATKTALTNEVRTAYDDWFKAMESFYAVQECLLTLCFMVMETPSSSQNAQRAAGLTVLLKNMKEELGQRIAEEKAARNEEATVAVVVPEGTDKTTDVDVLKSDNAALTTKLEALGDDWLNMSAAFFAFVKHLVKIGLIVAPSEGFQW